MFEKEDNEPEMRVTKLDLGSLLARMGGGGDLGGDGWQKNTVENLNAAWAQIKQRHTFEPGDIVGFKPGLCTRTIPGPGGPSMQDIPMLVLEVLPEPIRLPVSHDNCTKSMAGEVFDLRVAFFDRAGDLEPFVMESWRLQPYSLS